jgi:tRNA (cmo5U34)-methyltransferase
MSAISFNAEAAKSYDDGPRRLVPGYAVLQHLIALLLESELGDEASILVMAAGGGAELMGIAPKRAGWKLAGVDPSPDMLALAEGKLRSAGYGDRVTLVTGYVADAPEGPFDAATSCLVMLFIADDGGKLDYLHQLRRRLRPGAPLFMVEGFAARDPAGRERYIRSYTMHALAHGVDESLMERAVSAQTSLHYVSVERHKALFAEAGFDNVEQFFQALHIHGWIARA